jgi:hypothetical protein
MEERRSEGRREDDARLLTLAQKTHDMVLLQQGKLDELEHDVRGNEDAVKNLGKKMDSDFKALGKKGWQVFAIAASILVPVVVFAAGSYSDAVDGADSERSAIVKELGAISKVTTRLVARLDEMEKRADRHEEDFQERRDEYIKIMDGLESRSEHRYERHVDREHAE